MVCLRKPVTWNKATRVCTTKLLLLGPKPIQIPLKRCTLHYMQLQNRQFFGMSKIFVAYTNQNWLYRQNRRKHIFLLSQVMKPVVTWVQATQVPIVKLTISLSLSDNVNTASWASQFERCRYTFIIYRHFTFTRTAYFVKFHNLK